LKRCIKVAEKLLKVTTAKGTEVDVLEAKALLLELQSQLLREQGEQKRDDGK
jgi:hypothetical protein